MFQRHPDSEWQYAAERRARMLDYAARERMLAHARAAPRSSAARWLIVALVGAAPLALVLVLMVVLR
jgi:hypothetical protein